ncbi:hypothetical protein ABQF03_02905 [Mycolicibacterium phlei]
MFRYGIAAVALAAGIACGAAPGIAWAETSESGAPSAAGTSAETAAPADVTKPDDDTQATRTGAATTAPTDDADELETPESEDAEIDLDLDTDLDTDTDLDIAEPGETPAEEPSDDEVPTATVPEDDAKSNVEQPDPGPAAEPLTDRATFAVERPVATVSRVTAEPAAAAVATLTEPDEPALTETVEEQPLALVGAAAVETTTPVAPQPLSPIAQVLELPGRIINAVLELLDFTSYANSPTLPIGLGPINDLLFAAFREFERLVGLWDTPPVQPEVPTLVYDGPTDLKTPTGAQFLNAATAAYVLGGTPGGLQPFVVDGFQMSITNIFSGTVGKAWVTPEGQVIIAYQGTTGGSHLLFNPLIVISQLIADLQVAFTGTTPWAFHDAYNFAQRVRAEAAEQGYADSDIFVTGHSLGGWQAQYVSQRTGLAGIGFEGPGFNTKVPGNGADSLFVNIATYGSTAPLLATDLPGLQPFMPPFVPGGGSKPHYGPIVMIGDPAAATPVYNAAALWGKGLIGSAIFLIDFLGNFFQYHLPGVQAYHLGVTPDPGVVPWMGTRRGPVHDYADLTIQQLLAQASDDGRLYRP